MVRGTILASNDGKYTRQLLDSVFFDEIEHLVVSGVVVSNPNAQILIRAGNLHVPTYVVDQRLFPNGTTYAQALLHKLRDIDTDFVVLDGFTPDLGAVAKHYCGRIFGVKLNPVYQTMEIVVYTADAQGGVGSVLAEASVALRDGDTQNEFARRVYDQAETLLLEAVIDYCNSCEN